MNPPSRKLDILLVSSDKYPPFRPAARVIFEQEMVKRGHRIDWLVQAQSSCGTPYQISIGEGRAHIGATDDGESRWHRLNKHLLDLANDCRMMGLVKRNRYDLIQVKDKYLSAVMAIIVARALRVRFFYWLAYPHAEASIQGALEGIARYPVFYRFRGHLLKFLLYRIILPAADHVFVQSEQMKRDIAQEGIAEEKMTPVPGSVNLETIPYRTADLEKPVANGMEQARIVYLGTLKRARRLDLIIRAFAKVLDGFPKAKLYLLGRGDMPEDEEFLQAEVARLGLDEAVVFTGHLPMAQAWEYIRRSHVCLSPYYPTPILLSTSPTKLVEYMAMGKAVVGNDHPEQRLVISESGAGLCVPWDEDAFAQAILRLLHDPEMAREMGLKGRRYVQERRTNSAMTDVVESTYQRICKTIPVAIPKNPERAR